MVNLPRCRLTDWHTVNKFISYQEFRFRCFWHFIDHFMRWKIKHCFPTITISLDSNSLYGKGKLLIGFL